MAQVMVDKPVKIPPPPPEEPVDMELEAPQEEEEDLYTKLKTLQRQLEFYEIQVHSQTENWQSARLSGNTQIRQC